MKATFFIASAILILAVNSCNLVDSKKHIQLINPQATEKTVKLFNFIQDIQGQYTISGQHNFLGKGSDYSEQLEEITGKKAIIWGSDFSFCVEGEDAMQYQHCGPANLPAIPWERFKARRDSINSGDSGVPARDYPGNQRSWISPLIR